MAVGMLMMIPGGTQELYEQVNQKMFGGLTPDKAPDGLIMHSAGPAEGGWYVYDVWESKGDFERFANEQLASVVEEVAPAMAGGEPQFFDIDNLVVAN